MEQVDLVEKPSENEADETDFTTMGASRKRDTDVIECGSQEDDKTLDLTNNVKKTKT